MKAKTVFFCTECGNEYSKWMGQCTACGSWNTLVEQVQKNEGKTAKAGKVSAKAPVSLKNLSGEDEIRFSTGISELDRVLGGGAVTGSLILVGGAPGIGKSTLLMQICNHLKKDLTVLYVTGEESGKQLKMRADRLGVTNDKMLVFAETDMDEILTAVEGSEPDILIMDSIQTLYSPELTSAPGSVGQVKECTLQLMKLAKDRGITVFVISHVNKEGAIAGPKVLEHMVDCVLYFEGVSTASYRILRAAKNRFGSTNEMGVFEMQEDGLMEVPNPSEMLLSGRPESTPGTCVACVMEGTRPILAEIQALLSPSGFNVPRRTSNGIDHNRAMLLLAVIEKRGYLKTSSSDAYINVIGGIELDEPAADLATVLAIASSYLDKPIPDDLVAVGEVGLTGELRSVMHLEQRLAEIARLGFTKCIMPANKRNKKINIPSGLTIIEVNTVAEAIRTLLGQKA